MKQPGNFILFVTLTFVLLGSQPVHAWNWEWLHLYPTEIEAIVEFDGTDRSTSDSFDTRFTEWQAGLRIAQQGYILDPGIARFQAEIEPVYIWGRYNSKIDPEIYSGDILSYLFQLDLLQGTPGPFSYSLAAMSTRNLNTGSLGGRYLTEFDSKSAAMLWKSQAFPMNLRIEERTLMQDFLTGQTGSRSQRDEVVRTITAKGRSSKTNLLLEHQSVDDRVPDRDLDFEVDRATVSHNLSWGHNSYLRSGLDYYDRTGFNANKRLSINEVANIQHTDSVFSQSAYRFNSFTQSLKTTEHTGEFKLFHTLYNNLITSSHLYGSTIRSDPVDETRWRAGLEAQYNKQDLWGADVSAGVAYSYQLTDRDSRLGLIEVVDESHVVTLGGAVILGRRFIINASIIVTSADSTLVYENGFDYTIIDLPDDLTQVQIIPGGRIEPGDTILVSYSALALPSQEFSTTFTKYNLAINLDWVRFSHYDRKSDDKLISGAGESFLNPYRDIITDLEFRWKLAEVDAFASAERRFSSYSEFESTNYTFQQLLTWASSKGTVWDLNAVESFTEAINLDTDLYSIEISATWQPTMTLSIRPTLGAWKRLDTGDTVSGGERDNQFLTAGFTLRWFYRKVSFNMAYKYNHWVTDSPLISSARKTNENRLMFNLSRSL